MEYYKNNIKITVVYDDTRQYQKNINNTFTLFITSIRKLCLLWIYNLFTLVATFLFFVYIFKDYIILNVL